MMRPWITATPLRCVVCRRRIGAKENGPIHEKCIPAWVKLGLIWVSERILGPAWKRRHAKWIREVKKEAR